MTIRVWNENSMIMASEPFETDLTALDWAPNGQFLVAGDRNGMVHLIEADSLEKLGSPAPSSLANKPNAWIEDIKISPDSKMVAFGTHGGLSKIDLFKVEGGNKLTKFAAVDIKISSAVIHLDWSTDSRFLVVNS